MGSPKPSSTPKYNKVRGLFLATWRLNMTVKNTAPTTITTKEFQQNLEDITRIAPTAQLEEALYRVLNASRLDVAKEIAADAVGEDVEEYLADNDLDDLEFSSNLDDNEEYPEELNFLRNGDEEYPI